MGLLSRVARQIYRPRNAAGVTVATERFPFGFVQAVDTDLPRVKLDQFLNVDEAADYGPFVGTPEEMMVNVDDLVATQRRVHEGFLDRSNKKPVTVFVGEDGRLVLFDGHHRAARAVARGETEIPAKVFRGPA